MKKRRLILLVFALSGCLSGICQSEFDSLKRNSMLDTLYQPSQKPTFTTEYAELKISGFVQPALYYDLNNVFNNDFFITSDIPTTDLTHVNFNRYHMSANQSRLGFNFKFPKAGNNISAFIEGDFLSSKDGANTFFRLRHAYLTVGDFLVGQSWTNFGDVNASPNTLDLEGPNSMPASRVAQIRWTKKLSKEWRFIIAVEEPKADYTPLDSAQKVKSGLPEFVVKPSYKFAGGTWINSLIYKTIVYTDNNYDFKKKLQTWGFTSSLSLSLPDKLLGIRKKVLNIFGIIGRGTQGSVNDFGGLGFEAFPKDTVSLKALLYYGGYISFSFVYNKRWSSTYVYSYLHQQSPPLINNNFKYSLYYSANAVYAINKYFTIGGELLYGVKENYDDSKGSSFRFLAIMRLIF